MMLNISNIFILFSLSLFVLSCTDIDQQVEDCIQVNDSKILTEDEIKTLYNYTEVYEYNCKVYLLDVCPVCSIVPIPVDCDGENLSNLDDYSSGIFHARAEFLFYIESK